ncbi:hypothetical protein [Flavobacterium psychrophilum]|uniref:hypothetical protein n=1 Tax=Flavobacterium psychrophilum TaxID=96345 RepID=UPI0010694555|nr:hypothetical protein [Flavobacterium psychrophilum]
MENKELEEIKKKLPIGAVKVIAEKIQISEQTVTAFFKGKKIKTGTELKILNATTELIKTVKEQKEKALQELKAVASA